MNIRRTGIIKHEYAPAHRGAPYLYNGRYMNSGEFLECAVKSAYGVSSTKDANTRFDAGNDMPEYSASIKSAKATLTSVALGDTRDEILDNYFARTASKMFIYAFILDETLHCVEMNAEEFRDFTENFSYVSNTSSKNGDIKVIRYKTTSMKMIKWFEAHV